ncbi:MAG TPA: hypothetical protein VGO93_26660, partial [Candidatus Xenobia bacterium]
MSEIHPDFKELLSLFNTRGVEYVIVGAFALAHHGAPRYTGDLDILVQPDRENARNILEALRQFGFGSVGLTEADFELPDRVVQLGYPPVRVDLITSISGVGWMEARQGAVAGRLGDVPVRFLGRAEL